MNRKVIIGLVVVCIVGGLGVVGYKYLPKLTQNKTVNQVTQEELEVDKDTTAMVNSYENGERYTDSEPLTEEERKAYIQLYEKYGKKLSEKITVTDTDIAEAKAEGIQYPARKLTVKDGNSTRTIYIEDVDEEVFSVGSVSSYGEVVAYTELSEADKEEIVRSLVHNKKLSDILYKEVKSRE